MQEKFSKRFFEKNSRFAHFGQKLSKIGHLAGCVHESLYKGWESLKNLKVGVFETDFMQVPFVLQQTTHTYSESWGPVENFLTPTFLASNHNWYATFFPLNRASEFSNFLLEAYTLKSKDNYVFTFWWKFQKWPFSAKIDPNLA